VENLNVSAFHGFKPHRRQIRATVAKLGTSKRYIYTYPAKKSLVAITAKVKMLCRQISTNQPLDALLDRVNPVLRGWCAYFRVGVSSATSSYLRAYAWKAVWGWLRRKHPKSKSETDPPPVLRRQMVASHPGDGTLRPRLGCHSLVPPPRDEDTVPLAGHRMSPSHEP